MASYNGKYGTTTLENVDSNYSRAPETKVGKLKAHFKRFWWLHLINFLIGTVIVTLLLTFVGMPNIAQKGINDAWLTLESQVVTNPTPDSVHVRMNITSHSKSMFHPRLDAFDIDLFMEDTIKGLNYTPFGRLSVPSIVATAEATIIVDQELKIANMEQFTRYNRLILESDVYRVAQRGKCGLKEGAFPKVNVDFNKVITSKGLNNLKGFGVRDITISLIPDKDGSNMKANVYIPNPSPVTVSLGTVTQNVFVGNQQIATALIPNLTLKPGDNLIPMTSTADQATVIGLITTQYKDGKVPVRIVGNNSTINGVDLPYFTAALKAQTLYTTLDLAPALKGLGIDINALSGGGAGAGLGSGLGSSSTGSSLSSAAPLVPAASSSIVAPVAASSPAPLKAPVV